MPEKTQILLEKALVKSLNKLIRPEKENERLVKIDVDLFNGYLYTGQSHLEKKRRTPWVNQRTQVKAHPLDRFKPIFILGYNLKTMNLFYEIWYSTNESVYKIFDKFGKNVGQGNDELVRIVNNLIDIVWRVEDLDPKLRRDFSKELDSSIRGVDNKVAKEEQNRHRRYKKENDIKDEWRTLAKNRKFRNWVQDEFDEDVTQWERSDWEDWEEQIQEFFFYESKENVVNSNMFLAESWKKSEKEVDVILEKTISTRSLLAQALGDKIHEYGDTKLEKHQLNSLWGLILGKKIEFPSKYFNSGFLGRIRKVFGFNKEATFVTGWTFDDKLDFEIWYVKATDEKRDNFFVVFDMNSAKVVGTGFTKIRQAFDVIEKRLALPKSFFNDEDNEYNRRW